MRVGHGPFRDLAVLPCLAACLATIGCATLRELPRAEYAAKAERKGVVVDTREGLRYRFDFASFGPDSLIGHHLRDTEGPLEEYALVALPFEDVERLRVRRTDWLRSGLIAGGVLAAVVVAVARGRTTATDGTPGQDLPPPIP